MFYQVIRLFIKKGKEAHSVELFDSYDEAQKRFYNVLATDLGNDDIEYSSCFVINSDGLMVDGKVFDRRIQNETEE